MKKKISYLLIFPLLTLSLCFSSGFVFAQHNNPLLQMKIAQVSLLKVFISHPSVQQRFDVRRGKFDLDEEIKQKMETLKMLEEYYNTLKRKQLLVTDVYKLDLKRKIEEMEKEIYQENKDFESTHEEYTRTFSQMEDSYWDKRKDVEPSIQEVVNELSQYGYLSRRSDQEFANYLEMSLNARELSSVAEDIEQAIARVIQAENFDLVVNADVPLRDLSLEKSEIAGKPAGRNEYDSFLTSGDPAILGKWVGTGAQVSRRFVSPFTKAFIIYGAIDITAQVIRRLEK